MRIEDRDGFILAAYSIESVEGELDTGEDPIEHANKMDVMDAFISYIGSDNYKSIFEMYYKYLNLLTFLEKKSIAKKIINVISDQYKYEIDSREIVSEREVYYILDLISFLEFRYVDFFANVWDEMNVSIFEVDIPSYCLQNKEHIIKIIEDNIGASTESKYVINYLTDINGDDLVDFFIEKSVNKKAEIMIRISEIQNEEK